MLLVPAVVTVWLRFASLSQTRDMWGKGALIEELPPPDWPVGIVLIDG